MTVGYSGTPLARKLGIQEHAQVLLIDAPENYLSLVQALPSSVSFADQASQAIDLVHLFVTRKEALQQQLAWLRQTLRADAAVWVSWPKKSSKLPTNITEDTIRDVALPLGFVDIKVCAVSEVWSGLRIEDRPREAVV